MQYVAERNHQMLRGEELDTPKWTNIPMIAIIELLRVFIDHDSLNQIQSNLMEAEKIIREREEEYGPRLIRLKNRYAALIRRINATECSEETNSTSSDIGRRKRSTVISALLGIATRSDLAKAKKGVRKTQRLLEFLRNQEVTIMDDLTSVMKADMMLDNRTRILSLNQRKQLSLIAFQQIILETEQSLDEAEDVLSAYETRHHDSAPLRKIISIHGLNSIDPFTTRPFGCTSDRNGTKHLAFMAYSVSNQNVEVTHTNVISYDKLYSLRIFNTHEIVHSALWSKDKNCLGYAEWEEDAMVMKGLANASMEVRSTNERKKMRCSENKGQMTTRCPTSSRFNARYYLSGVATGMDGSQIECRYVGPHPLTRYRITGLEIMIHDLDLDNSMELLNKVQNSTSKLTFRAQMETLKGMKETIKNIMPHLEPEKYSILDESPLAIYAAVIGSILLMFRLMEVAMLLQQRRPVLM